MVQHLHRYGHHHKRGGRCDLDPDAADGLPGHHDHRGGRLASDHRDQNVVGVPQVVVGRLASGHPDQIALDAVPQEDGRRGGRLASGHPDRAVIRELDGLPASDHQGPNALGVHRLVDGRLASDHRDPSVLDVIRELDGRRGGRLVLDGLPILGPCGERVGVRHGPHRIPYGVRAAGGEEN